MLIFDNFESESKAREFMKHVTETYKVKAYYAYHDDRGYLFDESRPKDTPYHDLTHNGQTISADQTFPTDSLDVFPFLLIEPIVCVERSEETDDAIDATKFGGVFAGT